LNILQHKPGNGQVAILAYYWRTNRPIQFYATYRRSHYII